MRDAESGFEPGQKLFFGPLRHGVSAKNLYNNSKRQTLTFRGTWVWPERVNLYSRQTMVLPRETKNIRRISFLYHKTNQMHQLSQIYSGIKFYMFGAAPLPIIRSLFTVHSALVYVRQVCRQLSSRTILVLLESCLQTCLTYTSAECTVNKLLMMGRGTA